MCKQSTYTVLHKHTSMNTETDIRKSDAYWITANCIFNIMGKQSTYTVLHKHTSMNTETDIIKSVAYWITANCILCKQRYIYSICLHE